MNNILLLTEEEDIPTIILTKEDFPINYVNNLHPDDHKIVDSPIDMERIFHQKKNHNRLLLRISIRVSNSFISATFVCDTGAPNDLYLSDELKQIIRSRIGEDLFQNEFIKIGNEYALICSPPSNHHNINIIGLRLLDKFELMVKNGMFTFNNIPEYF
jgi:hypothetical protein